MKDLSGRWRRKRSLFTYRVIIQGESMRDPASTLSLDQCASDHGALLTNESQTGRERERNSREREREKERDQIYLRDCRISSDSGLKFRVS